MERNFNVDKENLLSLLDILKMYQNDKDVLEDRYKLERIISRFENHFYEADTEDTLETAILGDLVKYRFFKPFYPLAEEFLNTDFDIGDNSYEPQYTILNISDDEAFSTIEDFYHEQGEFFSSGFDEFEEEAEDHLKFIDASDNTDGEMVFLKSIGDAFVFCPNYSNITKMTILSHEVEHVIDCFKNPNFYENLLIRETVSMFMEMIAGDYCANRYNLDNDHIQRKLVIHSILKNHFRIFIDKIDMLEIIDKNSSLSREEIAEILSNNGFDLDCIIFLMEKNITEDFFYILAYLIALEVYFIYYDDKDKALNILKDIILNGNDYNILDIISKYGIILNRSVNTYEQKVLGKIKKQ